MLTKFHVAIWRHQATMTWWHHQMETFSVLLSLCAGNSPVPGEFPAQRPVTRTFEVFFDLRPNKRLSKQLLGWWFDTLSSPLWCHCNGVKAMTASICPCYNGMVCLTILTKYQDFLHRWIHKHNIWMVSPRYGIIFKMMYIITMLTVWMCIKTQKKMTNSTLNQFCNNWVSFSIKKKYATSLSNEY